MSGNNRNQKAAIIALIAVIILIVVALFLFFHILRDTDFSLMTAPFLRRDESPSPTNPPQTTFVPTPPSIPIPSLRPVASPTVSSRPSTTSTSTPDLLSGFDSLYFGQYKDEPIEWIVLDTQENHSFLLSKRAIETLPYHSSDEPVTWETCDIRAWLNGEFLDSAFTATELFCILPTVLDNSSVNPDFHYTVGTNDTEDKVFLLSHDEIVQYFPEEELRLCEKSLHAPSYDNAISAWWLRSPGLWPDCAEYVYRTGAFFSGIINKMTVDVRPAMWIKIDD